MSDGKTSATQKQLIQDIDNFERSSDICKFMMEDEVSEAQGQAMVNSYLIPEYSKLLNRLEEVGFNKKLYMKYSERLGGIAEEWSCV